MNQRLFRHLSSAILASSLIVSSDARAQHIELISTPVGTTAVDGGVARFDVLALSRLPLHYQWYMNDQPLAGQTGPSLLLSNLTSTASGAYHVVVATASSNLSTAAVQLRVIAANMASGGLDPAFARPTLSADAFMSQVAEDGDGNLVWTFNNGYYTDSADGEHLGNVIRTTSVMSHK